MRMALALAVGLLAGCAAPRPGPAPAGPGERIVSLDYCADQMVLGLAPRRQIAAVSPDADADPLFAKPLAEGIPRVGPGIERLLALRPTVVVRSYGGGPRIDAALSAAGVRVIELGYAADLPAARAATLTAGRALGQPLMAARRAGELDAALTLAQQAHRPHPRTRLLYTTPGMVTTGPDSLIGQLITTAGFANVQQRPGWNPLPLESMAADPPDVIVRAFHESRAHRQDRWADGAHRQLRAATSGASLIHIPGSELACGNWRIGSALRRLLRARAQVQP